MADKNVKSRLRFGIRKKGENIVTNMFKAVKRHSDGVSLMLQPGLAAEILNDEVIIRGASINVIFDDTGSPIGQKRFIPATAESIRAQEAALQHMAFEKGLSTDDATCTNYRVSQAQSHIKDINMQ